jgi:hypothetical protein
VSGQTHGNSHGLRALYRRLLQVLMFTYACGLQAPMTPALLADNPALVDAVVSSSTACLLNATVGNVHCTTVSACHSHTHTKVTQVPRKRVADTMRDDGGPAEVRRSYVLASLDVSTIQEPRHFVVLYLNVPYNAALM